MTSNFQHIGKDLYSYFDTTDAYVLPFNHYTVGSAGTDQLDDHFSLYMYGTRTNSGFFESNVDIGFYFQVDSISKVKEIGSYVNSIVGGTANNANYVNAKWIWPNYSMEGIDNGFTYWIYYTFYYSGSANTGTIYGACDDYAYLYFNNTATGSLTGAYASTGATNSYSVRIVNGLNYIRIAAYNGGSTSGFTWRRFSNYHNENPDYDATATETNYGYGITDFSNVSTATGGVQAVNGSNNYSIFWYGYFLSDYTGTWTFGLNSDDGSYLWLGDEALSGYTVNNSLINDGSTHPMTLKTATKDLVSGTYYPIRIMFGEVAGDDNCQFYWSKDNNTTKSYDFTGKVFSGKYNPAGLIVSLYDSQNINIVNSNGNWVYSKTASPYNTSTSYSDTNGALTFNSTTRNINNPSSAIPSGVVGGAPVFYYPFWVDTKDYATGTGVTDATLNGTTSPSISSTTSYSFYSSKSLYAANASCNMSIPGTTINSTVGFTVCFWYYITSSNAGMLWTINASSTATRVFIYNNGSNKIRVTVNSSDNDIVTLTLNAWTFIALVQPAGGVPNISLNNGTRTNLPNYAAVNFASSYHFLFGDPFVTSNYGGALGYMNNFYFFNRALSAAEITAIYNQ